MNKRKHSWRRFTDHSRRASWLIGVAACLATLNACIPVMRSNDLAAISNQFPGMCQSKLGYYQLSRTVLRIAIEIHEVNVASSGLVRFPILKEIAQVRIADSDPASTFCLDYLASGLANDTIKVKRSYKTQSYANVEGELKKVGAPTIEPDRTSDTLLDMIVSHNVDETAVVVRKLIRGFFIGISNDPKFYQANRAATLGTVVDTLSFDVDPFDADEMAVVNARINKLGLCFVLEDFTYDVFHSNYEAYCASPIKNTLEYPVLISRSLRTMRALPGDPRPGIVYRPRKGYAFSVLIKPDPKGPEQWRIARQTYFEMENASPAVSLGITRSIFAQRKTVVLFDDGVPVTVCIEKGSEFQGFVQIPLEVVRGIIELPSRALSVRIENAEQLHTLREAEISLINAQAAYIRKIAGTTEPSGPDNSAKKQVLKTNDLFLAADPTKDIDGPNTLDLTDPEIIQLCKTFGTL